MTGKPLDDANEWTPDELGSIAELHAELDAQAKAAAGDPPEGAITIGDSTFRMHIGTGTEVHLRDDDGNDLARIIVPTDLMPEPPSERDIIADAQRFYADMQAIRAQLDDGQVAGTAAMMHADGVFAGIADIATGMVRDSLTMLPDEADGDDAERIAARATEIGIEKVAEIIRDTFAGDTPEAVAMRSELSRSMQAHAWAEALADAREEAETLEIAYPHRPKLTAEQFDAITQRLFTEGSYVTRAMLDMTVQNAERMAKFVGQQLQDTPELADRFMAMARAELTGQPAIAPPPMMTPGFRDGHGRLPNDPIHRGAIEAMQNAADGGSRWELAPDRRPFFAVSGRGSWAATFFVSSDGDYATPEAALALVQQLDDDTADTFDIVLCQWLANRERDPSGLVYATAADILSQKGRAKHSHGGYRPEDRLATAQHMQALAALEVEGRNFERYEPGTGGKGRRKKVTIAPVGKLIEISVREDQKQLDGTRGPAVGWYYRVGAWSVAFQHDDAAAPMLARMSQKVIAYDSYQAKHAKRLGRYLTWQFRTRAYERSYSQPWTVGSLLAGAGIELPDNNPARFRERIEVALTMLRDDGVIGEWTYPDPITLPERKWLAVWLDWPIVVLPPAELVALYAGVGRRRKLASSKVAS